MQTFYMKTGCPLNNTTNYSLINYKYRQFTPNYPYEKLDTQFTPHQAFITDVELQFSQDSISSNSQIAK